ncbi:hypothetical protein G6M50_33975 [Agrobacterium rhizogenes]|nr:hypothetical protein [Rhizobium rhizogenes]NTJ82804.1 hypothetical protein [Rhizobium rhizogenes]
MELQAWEKANDYLSGTPYICTIFRHALKVCQGVSKNPDIFWADAGKYSVEAIDPAEAGSRFGDLFSMCLFKGKLYAF